MTAPVEGVVFIISEDDSARHIGKILQDGVLLGELLSIEFERFDDAIKGTCSHLRKFNDEVLRTRIVAPMLEQHAKPHHRNDRAYLKRKKGRA